MHIPVELRKGLGYSPARFRNMNPIPIFFFELRAVGLCDRKAKHGKAPIFLPIFNAKFAREVVCLVFESEATL